MPGHVHDPAAEGFAKGVCADVLCLQLIDGLDLFKMAVHHLRGQDRSVSAGEARLRKINTPKGPPAVPGVLLETLVYLYLPAFPGLLLIQGERAVLGEYLLPSERPQVGESQPEEAAAADEQGHPVVSVPIQAVDEVHRLVPFDVVRRRVLVLKCHLVED